MYTHLEIMELLKDREDTTSILDLLDPDVDEFVDCLEDIVFRNHKKLNAYYMDEL